MTRSEALQDLGGFVKILRDTREGDAVADLLNHAWPEAPPFPLYGWGDPFDLLRPRLDAILRGWDLVARQNGSAALAYRDGAHALRWVIAQVEARP